MAYEQETKNKKNNSLIKDTLPLNSKENHGIFRKRVGMLNETPYRLHLPVRLTI